MTHRGMALNTATARNIEKARCNRAEQLVPSAAAAPPARGGVRMPWCRAPSYSFHNVFSINCTLSSANAMGKDKDNKKVCLLFLLRVFCARWRRWFHSRAARAFCAPPFYSALRPLSLLFTQAAAAAAAAAEAEAAAAAAAAEADIVKALPPEVMARVEELATLQVRAARGRPRRRAFPGRARAAGSCAASALPPPVRGWRLPPSLPRPRRRPLARPTPSTWPRTRRCRPSTTPCTRTCGASARTLCRARRARRRPTAPRRRARASRASGCRRCRTAAARARPLRSTTSPCSSS